MKSLDYLKQLTNRQTYDDIEQAIEQLKALKAGAIVANMENWLTKTRAIADSLSTHMQQGVTRFTPVLEALSGQSGQTIKQAIRDYYLQEGMVTFTYSNGAVYQMTLGELAQLRAETLTAKIYPEGNVNLVETQEYQLLFNSALELPYLLRSFIEDSWSIIQPHLTLANPPKIPDKPGKDNLD